MLFPPVDMLLYLLITVWLAVVSAALKAGMEGGADDIMHTIYGNLAHVSNKLGTYKDSEKYARLAIRKKPDWFKVKVHQF